MYKRIVVTGSIAYDHIMSMPSKFSDHIMPDKIHILNVSFIMQKFKREFGGTGGNIAYNLALHGVPTLLVASAGEDILRYKEHLQKLKSLDLSGLKVFGEEMSANGFAITDTEDNQIWAFYEGAMKHARTQSLHNILTQDDLLVIAPNDPLAMIRFAQEAIDNKVDYMYDPAFNIPHIPTADLKEACENAKILIGNDYEIALILDRLGWNLSTLLDSVNIVITTRGAQGSVISANNKLIKIKSAKPNASIADPTGAGDAYRAGFLYGLFHDKSLKICGQLGSVTAVYTVEKYGTQTHTFTKGDFEKRYLKNYKVIS